MRFTKSWGWHPDEQGHRVDGSNKNRRITKITKEDRGNFVILSFEGI
jgi:hypothetical protein